MAMFYFNLQADAGIMEDPDGVDLPDLDAAWEEATKAAREIAMEAVRGGREDPPDAILITDAKGQMLGMVLLAEMIPNRLRSKAT